MVLFNKFAALSLMIMLAGGAVYAETSPGCPSLMKLEGNGKEVKEEKKPAVSPKQTKEATGESDLKAALGVTVKFQNYFAAVRKNIMERDYVVNLAELSLLSEEHLLLMGPPGNAKSKIADEILANITDAKTKTGSYFRIQMTPETTLSETHGPLDFKRLNEDSRYERIYSEGMVMSRNVFIDEIFDGRANSQRNILGVLAERAHAQGTHIIKGNLETAFAATNKYISEVYEKTGDDGPKALLDRFAFNAYIPGSFELVEDSVSLIKSAKKEQPKLPELTFQDLEKLRIIVPKVEIPDRVAEFLVVLAKQLKLETEGIEQGALKTFKEKLRNGEEPSIPYRATKYHSPRTLGKAAGILKAIVVRDWIEKGGNRPLVVTIDDVKKLEQFYTLNGPSDQFVAEELSKSSNSHERSQLMAITQEREIFRRNFNSIVNQINQVTTQYALNDLQFDLQNAKTPEQQEKVSKKLASVLVKIDQQYTRTGRVNDLSGEGMGYEVVREFLKNSLDKIAGSKADQLYAEASKQGPVEKVQATTEAAPSTGELEQDRIQKRLQNFDVFTADYQRLFSDKKNFKVLGKVSVSDGDPTSVTRDGKTTMVYDSDKGQIVRITVGKPTKTGKVTLETKRVKVPTTDEYEGYHNDIMALDSSQVILKDDSAAYLFNVDTKKITKLKLGFGAESHSAISPDGKTLYFFSVKGKSLVVYDIASGTSINRALKVNNRSDWTQLKGDEDEDGKSAFSISQDGKTLYVTSPDMKHLYALDPESGSLTYQGETFTGRDLKFESVSTPGGRYLFGLAKDDEDKDIVLKVDPMGTLQNEMTDFKDVDSALNSAGVVPLEHGYLSLWASENNGVVLMDHINSRIVATELFDLKNVKSIVRLNKTDFGVVSSQDNYGYETFQIVRVPGLESGKTPKASK